MSLDISIYVVTRSVGEYSDRSETVIVAFHSEDAAKEFVTIAGAQARDAWTHKIDYTTFDDEPALQVRRSIMTLDPGAVDPYDAPYYYYSAVPLFHALAAASGTEAGTAETTEIDSVHEGPTAESGDAQ